MPFRIAPALPIQDYNNVVIVGEAPGFEEETQGIPFVGQSGQELTHMLAEAGIIREQCYITNVFMTKPPGNDITRWMMKKAEADIAWAKLGNSGKYPFKSLSSGKYFDPAKMEDVKRLHAEVIAQDPNIVIALGNTPLWALTGEGGIKKVRGTLLEVDLISAPRRYKLLPTYHPAYILRQWADRPIVIADLIKAARESTTKTYIRPERLLWLEPSIADIQEFIREVIMPSPAIACDIETAHKQIPCVGFGTAKEAICIPFLDVRKPDWSYWATKAEEVKAWLLIKYICETLPLTKTFQNGMYDIFWLWKKHGITANSTADTMLRHHSFFPEMQKGLGFLGSIYTNETAWKRMRPRKLKTDKREDI
ncbi:uracil-DNA glycosylase [Candidatus Pacearchaeota archaeon]|nr:uracil-DNA glycosylase [Candidatus Pacearchaeota archaeon]